jgi:hypothetical protein
LASLGSRPPKPNDLNQQSAAPKRFIFDSCARHIYGRYSLFLYPSMVLNRLPAIPGRRWFF